MERILNKLQLEKIKFDCRHYSGYKPCGLSEFCEDCRHYQPIGVRILIIKLAAMGDVLRTTAILTGLKKQHPQSHITWITDSPSYSLLKNNPFIDRLLNYNLESVLTVMGIPYDLAINFEKEERALALFDKIKAEKKLGFAWSNAFTLSVANPGSLYSLQLGLHDELKFKMNAKSYQETIYEMAELPYEGESYVLRLSDYSREFAETFRAKRNMKSGCVSVGLNTGCGGVFETKKWTADGFCELARLLAKDGRQILLLGGQRECDFNQSILESAGVPVIDTGCDNSLEEFLGIVSLCDVVVSSDSLAAHIALALEKEVVIFFGSTCSQEVSLFGRGEAIVTDFPCSPCYKRRCDKKPTCMDALSAQTVYEAVCRRIGIYQSRRK
ncbi:glycosyltransferase family 9 protein [Candidatus Sumerlaeota bacterium]|nr:glycosyltransferase family 9 protein [Candidatus Sumerlaeota bacterium]